MCIFLYTYIPAFFVPVMTTQNKEDLVTVTTEQGALQKATELLSNEDNFKGLKNYTLSPRVLEEGEKLIGLMMKQTLVFTDNGGEPYRGVHIKFKNEDNIFDECAISGAVMLNAHEKIFASPDNSEREFVPVLIIGKGRQKSKNNAGSYNNYSVFSV